MTGRRSERNRPLYSERTWAPPWFWVLIWGACLLGAGVALRELFWEYAGQRASGAGAQPSVVPLALVSGFLLLFPTFLTLASSCLDVEVRSDHLFVAFGPLHLIRKRIPYAAVKAVEAVTYRPIVEFGGWGLRIRRGKTAWTIRGNQAARVTLSSGKQVYVGSRFPQRLAERMRRRFAEKPTTRPRGDG